MVPQGVELLMLNIGGLGCAVYTKFWVKPVSREQSNRINNTVV